MPAVVQFGQFFLPLILLLWLARWPAAGRVALVMQCVSVAAMLTMLSLLGLWTLPPWWMPWIYGLVFAVIVTKHVLAGLFKVPGFRVASLTGYLFLVAGAVPGTYGVVLTVHALAGRQLPDDVEVVDIALPFGPGLYLVAHGGPADVVNGHLRTLDPTVTRYRQWRGQSRALDIFRITRAGFHATEGLRPVDPAGYATFGTPLLSPCNGSVALAVDGFADMPVPQMDAANMAGNFIAVDCGGFFVILAHLRNGSMTVSAGNTVMVGDVLGEMGNSGNSSEPHLHVHAQRDLPADFPLSGEPLALTFNGVFPVRNTRIVVP